MTRGQPADVPIDVLHWGLAILPLIVLLVLLVGLRWQAQEAGPVGMFLATGLAIVAFETPLDTVAVASGKGVWDALYILYVVWTALLLYHVIKRGGGFIALEDGIQRFSDNELFLVLAFGWVFASFMQGIAGFGTPVAIVAPLLLVLGVKPVYAVTIPLIGHAWANLFGTLAVAWLATLRVVSLADLLETAVQTALLLWVPTLLAGFAIAWLFGRWSAIQHAWPMVVIIAAIHGGVQLLLVFFTPILSAFLATTVALVALYPLSRWERYDRPAEAIDRKRVMEDESGDGSEDDAEPVEADEEGEEPGPVMSFRMSLFPYAVLTVLAVLALLIPPVEAALEQIQFGLPFPETTTGYGVETEPETPYEAIAPLTHPGTFLLAATVVAWVVYRVRGYYEQWDERKDGAEAVLEGLADDAVPASIAIVVFLVMAQVMQHAGQTQVLAWGVALVAPPPVYAFLAAWIGYLGAFMTSSNTSSNILFAPLQQEAVGAMEDLAEPTIIAAQNAGGAVGNAIAPANVVLGTGAAGAIGEEGSVLRMVIPWTLLVMVLIGGLTVLFTGMSFVGG